MHLAQILKANAPSLLFSALCAACFIFGPGESPAADFPPGVAEMERIPAPRALPEGVLASGLEVDWTHPHLRAELALGAESGGSLPPLMQSVAQSKPGALVIQLAEPIEESGEWSLALPAVAAENPQRDSFRGGHAVLYPEATASEIAGDRVAVGGVAAWLPQGPGLGEWAEPESALANGAGAAAVRWLGAASEWRARPPEEELKNRALLSVLDPATGRGAFILLARNTADRVELASLAEWIEAAFPPRAWIALHSMGREACVRTADWSLGDAQTAVRDRAGAVLVLRAASADDAIDWAREPGARIHASSFETGHAPAQAASGRLWPSPFAPNIWMSRALRDSSRETPWIEVEFDRPRAIDRIRLIYPLAAGWSSDFNPAKLAIKVTGASSLDRTEPIEIEAGNREMIEVVFRDSITAKNVRIEVLEPTQFNLPGPARLAGVQVWGPPDQGR